MQLVGLAESFLSGTCSSTLPPVVHQLVVKSLIQDWQNGEGLQGLFTDKMKKIIINHSIEASVVSTGLYPENFPWGGSSLGSSCYVCTNVVSSLACGAMTSLACHESACAYDLILVYSDFFGGEASSLPSPPPSR